MATKDISDLQVVMAYAEMARQRALQLLGAAPIQRFEYADNILNRTTGQPLKVCERAMERAHRHGLVAYGLWLRGGFLTDKGLALLVSNELK